MLIAETWLSEVSERLGIPIDKLQAMNFYKEGQTTPYEQPVDDFFVHECFERVKQWAGYDQRRAQVDQFNREHKWRREV